MALKSMLCFGNNNIVVDAEMFAGYIILYLRGQHGGQLIIYE